MAVLLGSVAGDFPAGRRHRHHEHHAGVGHRTHARDRHPHGRRRAQPRHHAAISRRGGRHGRHRRHDRHPARHRQLRSPQRLGAVADPDRSGRSSPSPFSSPAPSASSSVFIPPKKRRIWIPSTRCDTSSGAKRWSVGFGIFSLYSGFHHSVNRSIYRSHIHFRSLFTQAVNSNARLCCAPMRPCFS